MDPGSRLLALCARPEPSRHEERTAAIMAAELRRVGYTVTEHIGKYSDGLPAFGIERMRTVAWILAPRCSRSARAPRAFRHEERSAAIMAAELRKAGYTVTEHIGKYSDGSPAFGIEKAPLSCRRGSLFGVTERYLSTPASIERMRTLALILASALLAAAADDSSLLALYRDLHAHPELSRHEEHTAAIMAAELRKAGYTVTEHIGKYSDGSAAFGIVALLKNGAGPTVLLRTELDALPVEEKTGAPFASIVRSKNASGQDVGVMHACGHDLHMMSLLGAAQDLARFKDRWSGTLMLVGQPAEETVEGARAMLSDRFYERFGTPDYAIALHNEPTLEAGKVGLVSGPVYASATTVEVRIRGLGGHGAHPESTKDPVVMAAEYVMAIQTIVSRETLPLEPAVVTVGSIHGGSKNNIIPDEVVLQLTIRAFNEDVRENILSSLDRKARGIALAAGVPEDRAPIVKVFDNESVPATYNDPKLVERLRGVFIGALGKDNVADLKPIMVSEDFGLFGLEGHRIPLVLFLLGTSSAQQLEESRRTGKPVPSLHSSTFLPQAEPALRTGIAATTSAVLDLLKR